MGADGLNDSQREAATCLEGPLLIEAGAGSGKTRTLAHRFANAVVPGRVPGWRPAEVDGLVAVTFTKKAAGELSGRVRRALRAEGLREEARGIERAWMDTIHGLCSRLLRRHALEAGVDPGFSVLDDVQARRMFEHAFEQAASEAMRTSNDVAHLLGVHQYAAVRSAVRGLVIAWRQSGGGIDVEPTGDAGSLAMRLRESVERAREGFAALGDEGARANTEACEAVLEGIAALTSADLPPVRFAHELWAVVAGYPAARPRARAARAVRLELESAIAPLSAALASVAAAPLARALGLLAERSSERYERLKRERAALDFEDLQLRAVALLEDDPVLAGRYREKLRLVMVDEAQDTDGLQLRIAQALAGPRLCLVGDGRQSIYGFRGADVEAYRRQTECMRAAGAREVTLARNYRSHAQVLEFVNALFGSPEMFGTDLVRLEHARAEPEPPLLAEGSLRVEIAIAERLREGAARPRAALAVLIARRFAEMHARGQALSEMVVLLPTYTQADAYAGALERAGLPAAVVGGRRFFGLPEVAFGRAFYRLVSNTLDDQAAAEVLSSSLGGLSPSGLWRLARSAEEKGVGLWEAASSAAGLLDGEDRDVVANVREVVERACARAGAVPLGETLLRAVEESGLDLRLLETGREGARAFANLLKLARMADGFEADGGVGPGAFAAHLDESERLGERQPASPVVDGGRQAVRVMSIHAAKGLEFAAVAVAELDEAGRANPPIARWERTADGVRLAADLPAREAALGEKSHHTTLYRELEERSRQAEAEELKRLFYVACTRATDRLLLTGMGPLTKAGEGRDLLRLLRVALGLEEVAPSEGSRDHPACAQVALTVLAAECLGEGEEGARCEEPAVQEDADPPPPASAPGPPPAPAPGPPAPAVLSYSDLALFAACPARFHAERVLRLAGRSLLYGDQRPRRAGSALHAVLSLAGAGVPPRDRMEAIARHHGLEERDLVSLERAVAGFLGSGSAERLRSAQAEREVPFALRVGVREAGFTLVGTMDAYAKDGDEAFIVDYKTGETTPEEAERAYRLQARCYALAALREGARRVTCVFSLVDALTWEGTPREARFGFVAEDAAGIEAELLGMHERMSRGEYPSAGRGRSEACGTCPAPPALCQRPGEV